MPFCWFSAHAFDNCVSSVNFNIGRGSGCINMSSKVHNGKVLSNLGLKLRILQGPLNHTSACLGFCTSHPHKSVDIGGINFSYKIPNGKVLAHLGSKSKVFTGSLAHLSAWVQGRIQGGGGRPLKLEKIWFFGVNWWFFTRNTPKTYAPTFARRNFSKCSPLTWNPGSATGVRFCLLSSQQGFKWHLRW